MYKLLLILFIFVSCNTAKPAALAKVGVQTASGAKDSSTGNDVITLIAKNRSLIIFMYAKDSVLTSVKLDSLIFYYNKYKHND